MQKKHVDGNSKQTFGIDRCNVHILFIKCKSSNKMLSFTDMSSYFLQSGSLAESILLLATSFPFS